jgi:hypothetical protein
LVELTNIGRLSEQEKDLGIMILRHQLAILEQKPGKPVKPKRAEKVTLATPVATLKQVTNGPISWLTEECPMGHGNRLGGRALGVSVR